MMPCILISAQDMLFFAIYKIYHLYETMKPFICAASKYVNIIEQLWFHIIKPIDFVKTLIDEIKFTIPRQKHMYRHLVL